VSKADFAGQISLYVVSLTIYVASNILLAAPPPHIASLFILKAVQAFGGASVISLGARTVADITSPKNRASAMSIVLLKSQLGPALGLLIGGALASSASWRWIFGFLGQSHSAGITKA